MVELNKLYNQDCFTFMESLPRASVNIIYTDVPYNMGSRYVIDSQGHYRFKGQRSDFMGKWEAMDGDWWYRWFTNAYRVLKPGGFLITHNIDRQADLWTYYARRSGFFPTQKMYWLFIDNFPKGVDLALGIDNALGVERNIVGQSKGAQTESTGKYGAWGRKDAKMANQNYLKGKMNVYDKTEATSEIAKKYDGYKYGQAPLKQVMEEILVFVKEYDNDLTIPKAVVQYEEGKKSGNEKNIHLPIYNLAECAVRPSKAIKRVSKELWTPQLFVDTRVGEEMLSHLSHQDAHDLLTPMIKINFTYEDYPPYIFCRKPSVEEKEAGLESLEWKKVNDGRESEIDNPFQRGETKRKNIHPTVKPIELCTKILTIFKTPDPEEMVIYDPFSGSCTIPISCEKVGMKWIGTEINPDFVQIGNLRLQYHRSKKEDEPELF